MRHPHPRLRALFLVSSLLALPLAHASAQNTFESVRTINDVRAARAALQKGASPNVKNSEGYTWLHLCMATRNLEIARLLVEKGADIDARTTGSFKKTPLDEAITYGFVEGVRLLLEKGARTDNRDNFNQESALHVAAAKHGDENTKILELLIRHRADLEAPNKFKQTPLFSAIGERRNERVRMLLLAGAKVSARQDSGATPFLYAAVYANHEALELLARAGADVRARDNGGENAYIVVLRSGNDDPGKLDTLAKLGELGVDAGAADKDGNTALYWAALKNDARYVEAMLAAGCDPDHKNNKGLTVLDQMIINGWIPLVALLARRSKELDALDKYGTTRLISAAINDRADVARALVEAGADVNAQDKWGKTALYHARYVKADALARYLESKGAR